MPTIGKLIGASSGCGSGVVCGAAADCSSGGMSGVSGDSGAGETTACDVDSVVVFFLRGIISYILSLTPLPAHEFVKFLLFRALITIFDKNIANHHI